MKMGENFALALASGFVITLYTGLINSTPGGGFVGATWYGWPASWLIYRVLAPQYSPIAYNYGNLVIDVIAWTIVAFVVLWFATRGKRK